MVGQLINCLGGIHYHVEPWVEAKQELLTYIDAQIAASWDEFNNIADYVADEFQCTRATEAPDDDGEGWAVSIPHCKRVNTKCSIEKFVDGFRAELERLVSELSALDESMLTDELRRILAVASKTIKSGRFPFEGRTCRSVADLIIGLQSVLHKALVSSNYKEHQVLHKVLNYTFLNFPISEIRSK